MSRLRIAAALLLLCGLFLPARASVVLEVSVERLAERADRIVRGKVVERSVGLTRGAREIWTRYRIDVAETLAGPAASSVVVHVPGGRVGTLEQEIHGVARLEPDRESLLFLWTDRQGRHRVLGQAQGAFRIHREGSAGEATCTNSVDGLILVDEGGRKRAGRASRLALSALRERITEARRRRAERERLRELARKRRLEEAKKRAERTQRLTDGKPGTAE